MLCSFYLFFGCALGLILVLDHLWVCFDWIPRLLELILDGLPRFVWMDTGVFCADVDFSLDVFLMDIKVLFHLMLDVIWAFFGMGIFEFICYVLDFYWIDTSAC